jgi:hypothetical protein
MSLFSKKKKENKKRSLLKDIKKEVRLGQKATDKAAAALERISKGLGRWT